MIEESVTLNFEDSLSQKITNTFYLCFIDSSLTISLRVSQEQLKVPT
jgi:hypothetical protein